MRPYSIALSLAIVFCLGCGGPTTAPLDASVAFRTGSDRADGVEWSYAFVSEKGTGKLLYAAVVYGRGVLDGKRPTRGGVPIDGKMVTMPAGGGSLFVIDSSLNCHQAPLGPEEVTELAQAQAAGALYSSALWARLRPFLRLYEAAE